MALQVRELTAEEHERVRRLAHSRTDPARLVERARIIWLAQQGRRVPAIAAALRRTEPTVRLWLKRFNTTGLAGLEDQPRAGRPPTYTPEEVGAVLAASLTDPQRLDQALLMFEKMLGFANHLGLFGEQIGAHGEALGNYPQALTHLALISSAYNLDRTLG